MIWLLLLLAGPGEPPTLVHEFATKAACQSVAAVIYPDKATLCFAQERRVLVG